MATIERVAAFPVQRPLRRFTLDPFQQRDHRVLTLCVTSPAGQGGPSALDVARQLRFTCSFR